jgi:pimeloyl-ACP methyl ester carboxylesterase
VTRVGGLELLEWGPASGRPVICLHGFPDVPLSWAPVAERLAAAGWRVVAPYMRGYHPSTLEGPFTVEQLATDLLALAGAVSPHAPVAVVGHDWGAVATYAACSRAPERIARAVTMAVPHPTAFLRNLPRVPGQLARSWYMMFFQLPRLPEWILRRGLVRRLWRRWSPGWEGDAAEIERTIEASLPAPLEYYRAAAADLARGRRLAGDSIRVPTMWMHGVDDGCIDARLGDGQERYFVEHASELISGAGHFLHLERPDVVAGHVLRWISRAS